MSDTSAGKLWEYSGEYTAGSLELPAAFPPEGTFTVSLVSLQVKQRS